MKIGIIGVGNIGATLARKFSAVGHSVSLANSRGPESIREIAREANATAVALADVVKGADVVVVSIPEKAIPQLPKDLFAKLPKHVVVIDTGNYYPVMRDEPVAAIESGMPESQWVAEQLGRPVVKAFNSILSQSLAKKGQPGGLPGRIALPVAGDETDAKKIVIGLVNDTGFEGVDAGTLGESWRQQPGTPAYCTDIVGSVALKDALARAVKDKAPGLRDLALQRLGQLGSTITNDDMLLINRALHD
ncbi:NADP oxidoreductase coenzyme F420-dependent (plasmid) [Rahnella aceris]|uniref:NADP oxidoreductase coenzyme F420-dependent n=1 Tax=Rahnella sp. (strain Y9602) TaxID=2703885 RepID=A0A0H3FP30_RAHSY|nr:NAD(P)-binding domain-containing protein [Rahnella aceris]ADW76628.1 NADP oxidoreductase coenzyme F420-dependent [Rahnella aceris]